MGSAATRSATAPGWRSRSGRASAIVRSDGPVEDGILDESARTEQRREGDRVRGRERAVEEFLWPHHECLGVGTSGEEATGVLVPEELAQLSHGGEGAFAPQWSVPSIPTGGDRPRPARRSRPPRRGAAPGRPASCASAVRRGTWTPRGRSRSLRPGVRTRSCPMAEASSARVAAVMAFHSVRTFSSRAGWTRSAARLGEQDAGLFDLGRAGQGRADRADRVWNGPPSSRPR